MTQEVRILAFNTSIAYPKNVEKEGFTFNGWDKIIGFMPAEDITITAQWCEKDTDLVKIVFKKKDMSEEEAKEIIKGYTSEGFVIEKLDYDENTGETIVTIKFVDSAKTTEFVRNVNENNIDGGGYIKSVNGYYSEGSFSLIFSPLLIFNFMLI